MRQQLRLLIAAAGTSMLAVGQETPGIEAGQQVLVETTFKSPLTEAGAIGRLDEYYQEQIGQTGKQVLQPLTPGRYFDNRRDIWLSFSATDAGMTVSLKRFSEAASSRIAKSWMLEIAGRLGGEMPLTFRDTARVQTATTTVLAGKRDIADALIKSQSGVKPVAPGRHTSLFVGLEPLTLAVLETNPRTGVSTLTVASEKPAASHQLVAGLTKLSASPRISAVLNEAILVEDDVRLAADALERDDNLRTPDVIVRLGTGSKVFEDRVRSDPDMQKRVRAAMNAYQVKLRIDRPYRKVTVRWTELRNYSRTDGTFESEAAVGQTTLLDVHKSDGSSLVTSRITLRSLTPGAYRIRVESERAAGSALKLDERVYWFDGKTFQEL